MSFKINDYTKSREMFERAEKVIPSGVYGHLGPAEGCFIPVSAFPLFGDRAQGSYFWDVDGNKFIDYMCAYGPNVLGYNDPDVDAAALEQAKKCNCTTSPSYKAVEFAERQLRRLGFLRKERQRCHHRRYHDRKSPHPPQEDNLHQRLLSRYFALDPEGRLSRCS